MCICYIRISTRIECLSGLTGFVVSEENKTETRTMCKIQQEKLHVHFPLEVIICIYLYIWQIYGM